MWSYRLKHLEHLSTATGIFEHALYTEPRIEHGYCTDDNSRLLVVMTRERDEGVAHRLSRVALSFVLDSQTDAGLVRNRFRHEGFWRWVDQGGLGDPWGRAMWALGTAAANHANPGVRAMARWGFDRGVRQRSPWLRSTAFAALGAADLLIEAPDHEWARSMLVDASVQLLPASRNGTPWPERRLSYANAAIPEALMAAGYALEAPEVTRRGLDMLDWLLESQLQDGHLSVVGSAGRDVYDRSPAFDQQPIEVAALADACWRAWSITGQPHWRTGIAMCADWFLGRNDVGAVMVDTHTSGCYDGLEPHGPNLNEGAESALALVSTMQRACALLPYRAQAALDPQQDTVPHDDRAKVRPPVLAAIS